MGAPFEGQGRDGRAVRAHHHGVVLPDYVQDHGVVRLVGLVLVQQPVGGTQVQLHLAHPFHAADEQAGLAEVGAGVGVERSRPEHLHRLAFFGAQVVLVKELVIPQELEERFVHTNKIRVDDAARLRGGGQ